MSSIRTRRLALAAALLATAAAAPAAARERFAIHGQRLGAERSSTFHDEGAPALVNGGVAYLDEPRDRAHVLFRAPGEPPRRLQQFEQILDSAIVRGAAFLALAGDGHRLALARYDDYPPAPAGCGGPGAVVAATLNGPADQVVRSDVAPRWDPRVDGNDLLIRTVGAPSWRCAAPLRPQVFDLASGGAFPLPVAAKATYPAIGGRYAAWADLARANGRRMTRGVVYDFRARRTVQSTGTFEPLAVAADGTVVARTFATESGREVDRCGHLWTYDIAAPAPRELPYYTCRPGATRIAGDRIAFLTGAKGWPLRGRRQRLMLGDTAGSPAAALSERYAWDRPSGPAFGFDFDGERVAYRTYSCAGERMLNVDEVSTALADGPIAQGTCGATIGLPDSPVDIASGFDATIDCRNGCAPRFVVRTGEGNWKLVTPHHLPLGPGHHTLHLRAPKARPATDHVVRAELILRVPQPDGHVAPTFNGMRILSPKR